MMDKVLVWSNQHKAWWRADSKGYSLNLAGAGLYEREEAEEIVEGCSGRDEEIVELDKAFTDLQKQAYESDKALIDIYHLAGKHAPLGRM